MNGHVWLIVAMAGVVLMGGLTFVATPPPMMALDSESYLNWSPLRTPGYPFFLWAVGIVDPELGHLHYFQMSLLVASAAFLAQAAARLGGPPWIWILMGVSILSNLFIWRYSWELLTDSVFITLVMVFLGCIAMALRRRPAGLSWLFATSVVLGAAILVRPVGYALLGVALLLGLVWHGRRLAAIGAAAIPAIVMLLAVSSWNFVNKGYFATQIFGGYEIVGRVALLITPDVEVSDSVAREAIRRISAGLSPVRDHLLRESTSWSDYFFLTNQGYNSQLYNYALPAISAADRSVGITAASPVAVAKRIDALAWSIALATIRHYPGGYIINVLANFAGLWTWPDISSAGAAAALRKKLCDPAFEGFYCNSESNYLTGLIRINIPGFAVPLKDGLLFGLMALSFVLIFAAATRPAASPLLVFAAVAALCINANHLLVALVAHALPRYAMAMWPALLVMISAFATWVWVSARRGTVAMPVPLTGLPM
jgi:hypothetical protein